MKVTAHGWDFTEPLTPAEVARIFAVDVKTVSRWALAKRIASIRTPGGHRRFSREQVNQIVGGGFTAFDQEARS